VTPAVPEPTVMNGSPTPSPTTSPVSTPTPVVPFETATPGPSSTSEPPLLVMLEPANEAPYLYHYADVVGRTEPGATVLVQGHEAAVDQETGLFSTRALLVTGWNTIEVRASLEGHESTASIRVFSLGAEPPSEIFLVVNGPPDGRTSQNPIIITGNTVPDAIVSVEGVTVPVSGVGFFQATVLLKNEGPNLINVTASTSDGQSKDKPITVFYRP